MSKLKRIEFEYRIWILYDGGLKASDEGPWTDFVACYEFAKHEVGLPWEIRADGVPVLVQYLDPEADPVDFAIQDKIASQVAYTQLCRLVMSAAAYFFAADSRPINSMVSPWEWSACQQPTTAGMELIVIHEGQDIRRLFALDYEDYEAVEFMTQTLYAAGYFFEEHASYCAAIYRRDV